MIKVIHDSEPTLSFMADALAPDWNGWAQPRFRSTSHTAYVLGALCGPENVEVWRLSTELPADLGQDRSAQATAQVGQQITWYDEDDQSETITRDDDGYFTLHGWTFHRASDLTSD